MSEPETRLVSQREGAWNDLEHAERTERYKAIFFEFLHQLAGKFGCDVDVLRSKGRWDDHYDPPRLLDATVRFRHPTAKKRRGKRGSTPTS